MAAAEALKVTREINEKVEGVDDRVQNVDTKVEGIETEVQRVNHKVQGVDDKVCSVIKGASYQQSPTHELILGLSFTR